MMTYHDARGKDLGCRLWGEFEGEVHA